MKLLLFNNNSLIDYRLLFSISVAIFEALAYLFHGMNCAVLAQLLIVH